MKQKYTAIAVGLALLLGLCACSPTRTVRSQDQKTHQETPEPSPTPVVIELDEIQAEADAAQELQPIEIVQATEIRDSVIRVEFVTEEQLYQLAISEYYADSENSEYAEKVLFSAEETVYDFRIEIVQAEILDDGTLVLNTDQTVYSADCLQSGDRVVFETEFLEYTPVRGISYTDAAGHEYHYYLVSSGESWEPLLIQYFA